MTQAPSPTTGPDARIPAAPAPGFADPVFDAQSSFRAILDAMAHPGRIVRLPALSSAAPPLTPAAAACALTLLDFETPVWLDPTMTTPEVLAFLRFHCGCLIIGDPAAAAFALIADAAAMPDLSSFRIGDEAYPDRSATLIAQVRTLREGHALEGEIALTLRGPGIRESAQFSVAGLPDDFAAHWANNHALYPLGADVILVARDRAVALPRSVAITEQSTTEQ